MKRVLAVTACYVPGYKGGGPIRSLQNLVGHLGDEYSFAILTSDRDLGDRAPYPGVQRGAWQRVGKAAVRYLSPREQNLLPWRSLLRGLDYDLVYLNGYFTGLTVKTLLLRRLRQIPCVPVVVVPQGQLFRKALSQKRGRKYLYMRMARAMALHRDIVWQASSADEARNIRAAIAGRESEGCGDPSLASSLAQPRIVVAPDLPPAHGWRSTGTLRATKQAGAARVVYLSSIARHKNLDLAIRLIGQVSGQVVFDIRGPVEDEEYWQECQTLIGQLPANVRVSYKGTVPPDQVVSVFSQYHLFLFPTRSENFGHVIPEALSAGCLVLTSDQTPWRNLAARGAGWDLPLCRQESFVAALQQLVSMDDVTYARWSAGAREVAETFISSTEPVEAARSLFRYASRG